MYTCEPQSLRDRARPVAASHFTKKRESFQKGGKNIGIEREWITKMEEEGSRASRILLERQIEDEKCRKGSTRALISRTADKATSERDREIERERGREEGKKRDSFKFCNRP